MLETLIKKIIDDSQSINNLVHSIKIPAKTILLEEGETSKNIYIVKRGALRMWFNKDGKDITFQFFFESMAVASIESFLNNKPSLFGIESIEKSELIVISKTNFETIMQLYPEFKERLFELLIQRLENYTHLFLSRIKDTPQERYAELAKQHPEIMQRVTQHYIASYLGITPISLSRIKSRIY